MDYINEGKVSDEYTKELDDAVEFLREDDGSEELYMTYQQTIMEHEARAMKKGVLNTVLSFFKKGCITAEEAANEVGMSVDELKKLAITTQS